MVEIDADEAGTEVDAEGVARAALSTAGEDLPDVLGRLTAFSDPTRLELLIAIHAAPGAAVKTLAAATGMAPNTVTQALASLREAMQRLDEADPGDTDEVLAAGTQAHEELQNRLRDSESS